MMSERRVYLGSANVEWVGLGTDITFRVDLMAILFVLL